MRYEAKEYDCTEVWIGLNGTGLSDGWHFHHKVGTDGCDGIGVTEMGVMVTIGDEVSMYEGLPYNAVFQQRKESQDADVPF